MHEIEASDINNMHAIVHAANCLAYGLIDGWGIQNPSEDIRKKLVDLRDAYSNVLAERYEELDYLTSDYRQIEGFEHEYRTTYVNDAGRVVTLREDYNVREMALELLRAVS